MAKGNSTNALLNQIIVDLEAMITVYGKVNQNKAKEESNVPKSNIANINVEQAKTLSNPIKDIGSGVKVLLDMNEKDVKHVSNIINQICQLVSNVKIKKEDVSGLQDVMKAFGEMNKTIGDMSKNFISSFLKFSPLKGKILGERLGKFYKNFIESFEKSLTTQNLKDKIKTLNTKNTGATLTGLSDFMKVILSMDWKQLLKVGLAWKAFPSSAGENIANFMSPIIEMIKTMPESEVDKVGSLTKGGSITHVANKKVAGFLEIFNALTSISMWQIIKLKTMSLLLNEKAGQRIGSFFKGFITKINEVDEKEVKEARKMIDSFTIMMGTLTLSLIAITATIMIAGLKNVGIGLLTMSLLVAESVIVIKILSGIKTEDTKGAMFSAIAISVLLLSLTASLAIVTSIVKSNEAGDIIGGLFIVGLLTTASLFVIKKLTNAKISTKATELLIATGAIALLFLSMSAVALIAGQIGKNMGEAAVGTLLILALVGVGYAVFERLSKLTKAKIQNGLRAVGAITLMMVAMGVVAYLASYIGKTGKESAIGAMIIAGLAFVGYVIFKQFAKLKQEEVLNGLIGSAAVAVVFWLLSYVMRDYVVPMIQDMSKIGWEGIVKGIGVTAVMVGGMIGIVYLLSSEKLDKMKMLKGAAVMAGIEVLIAGLSAAMLLYCEYLNEMKGISAEDIAVGSAIALAALAAMGALAGGIGVLMTGPQGAVIAFALGAGGAVILGLSGLIGALSGSMILFSEMIKKVNESLTETSINSACDTICGKGDSKGLVGCIIDIVKGLDDIGLFAAVKLRIISKNLLPLFTGLSKFVDMIQKMALMKMVDHYDAKGNPVYVPMDPTAFTTAATNLSDSFVSFLTKLNSAFVDGKDAEKIGKIIKSLTDGNVYQLMNSLCGFTTAITSFASLKIADQWDDKGHPIHYAKYKDEDFTKAGTTLATAFANFLTELNKELGGKSYAIKNTIENLTSKKGGIRALVDAVKSAVTPLATFSSGRMQFKGNYYKTDLQTLWAGGQAMVKPLGYVLTYLTNLYDKIDKGDIEYVCDTVTMFNKKMKGNSKFYINVSDLTKGSNELFTWLNGIVIDKRRMKSYTDSMDYLGKSLKRNRKIFDTSYKSVNNIAKSINALDKAIINRSDQRIKAINLMSKSFNGLSKELTRMNLELEKGVNTINRYRDMKEFDDKNFIINAVTHIGKVTEDVSKTVNKVHSDNAAAAAKTTDKTSATSNEQQIANMELLIQAFTNALNEWHEDHKDLTLELSGKGAVALGSIYGKK